MDLHEIIKDPNRLFIGSNIPEKYQNDIYIRNVAKAFAVALPTSKKEIIELVNYANVKNKVMIARGASSGVAGSQIPIIGGELIIDTSLMNNIIALDEETMTLTVEPGVTLEKIQDYVEAKGYFYPPDPGSKHSSIGGNVSTNAGGMRAVKYGTTRDYVRAIDVVLPNGEFTTLGSLNIKSSSGYDLKDLFIGSEGTLGIITQIKLKIIPKPKYKKSLILAFNNVIEATNTVIYILQKGYEPTALELFERSTIEYSEKLLDKKFQSQKGNAYILMTLDGNDEEFMINRINEIKGNLSDKTVEIVSLETEEDEELAWKLRDHILYALMELTEFELLDEVVPINKFAEMIRYTKELQEKYGVSVLNFGHAGDGNVHTVMMKESYDEETWNIKRIEFLNNLYEKVNELGGLPSAEHGIGILKKEYLLKMTDKVQIDLMRIIKNGIDPKGLLNPNKIF